MRLTHQEIEERGINVKGWLNHIQLAIRRGEAPPFEVAGPAVMAVRKRTTGRTAAATTRGNHSFFGGEKFTLGSIAHEHALSDDTIRISVSLVPVDLALAAEISGMTLLLDEAMEHFSGLKDWIERFSEEMATPAVERPKLARESKPKPLPREANPAWGCW